MNTATQPQPDLVTVICERTLALAADQVHRLNLHDHQDRLCALLRQEVKDGYDGLIHEMQEAERTFFGNTQMLATVLNVGCLHFVARAVKRLHEEAEMEAA